MQSDYSSGIGVAFIIPFLGSWPLWSELFFLSCGSNTIVTFIVVCEKTPPFLLPPNVRVVKLDRAELVARLEQATGLKLAGISGHKLCDFRPFFGIAFADLLVGQQFWGFCDVDMMLGDLGKLLTPGFLETVDVFSAHNVQIVGHFTILRNIPTVNRLGFKINAYAQKCLAPTNQMMDEFAFTEAIRGSDVRWVRPGSLAEELKTSFARFGITFRFRGDVAYLDAADTPVVRWESGAVYYTSGSGRTSEVLYLHFMGLKRWWHWCFSGRSFAARRPHWFSRLGYGRTSSPASLLRFPWPQVYWGELMLLNWKSTTGIFLRRLLPQAAFLKLRRAVFGRSRY